MRSLPQAPAAAAAAAAGTSPPRKFEAPGSHDPGRTFAVEVPAASAAAPVELLGS